MMDLNTFILEPYEFRNLDHRYISALLGNDQSVKKFISPDFDRFIHNVQTRAKEDPQGICNWYVAYLKRNNSNNIPIGMIALDKDFGDNFRHNYQIDIALLPEYRGENLGLILLQQFSYHIVDDLGVEKVNAYINKANIASIKNAQLVGFERNGETTYTLKGKSR